MKKRNCRSFYLMLLLPVVLVFIYSYIPMAGIVISFMDYKPALGFAGSRFVGLEHFRTLFNNPQFSQALENTVIIAFWKIVFGLVVPVTFALLLNEVRNTAYKRVAQTVVYLPHFISWVLMSGIIIDFLSATGAMNQLLGLFGMEPVLFLLDNKLFKPVLIVTDIWKSFGWSSIIYLSTITAIDPGLYEAAAVDGAGRFRKIWHVTLPAMLPLIVIQLILSIGNMLSANTDLILLLYNSSTYKTADVIGTYVYRETLMGGKFSYGTASGLLMSILSFALTYIANAVSRKKTDYSMW